MADLADHYKKLWEKAVSGFQRNEFELDPFLLTPKDSRFGITLIARPEAKVKKEFKSFLAELKKIAPEQYYYPETDMHITILSVISCYEGFKLSLINPDAYTALVRTTVKSIPGFSIDFRGVTASPSSIMIQGFPTDHYLNEIRDQLRVQFKKSMLQESIDKRYVIQSAHCTVARFKESLKNPADFIRQLNKYRNYQFGRSTVSELELVYNDWYQRKEKVKILNKFPLG